ncbi:CD225/dispanin family protein [Pontiellaceae bacterium B1224]|nr:CD225/dispanin family protein [Pontiellaceae bacterium B1224]
MEEQNVNIPNYLWQSIVVTILCCWPVGIPAIIFAAKVNGLVAQGKIQEAQEASAKAKMWCWICFALGLVAGIIGGVVQFAAIGAAAASGY